jgi:hypothetical protein
MQGTNLTPEQRGHMATMDAAAAALRFGATISPIRVEISICTRTEARARAAEVRARGHNVNYGHHRFECRQREVQGFGRCQFL